MRADPAVDGTDGRMRARPGIPRMTLIVTAMPGIRAKSATQLTPAASIGCPADPWRKMAQFEYEYASCWRQVLILEVIQALGTVLFKYFAIARG